MDPYESEVVGEIPPQLPLEGGQVFEEDYTMSCGTCHQPHLERLSETVARLRDEPVGYEGEIPFYKTYYLRMAGPAMGHEALCLACHADF
jgi:hypothetical protein